MATAKGIRAGKAFVELGAVDKTAFVLNRVSKRFKAVGEKIASMGRNAVGKAITTLLPAGLSTHIFMGFDDSMKKVSARSKGTAGELSALREQAKHLGRTTSFTAGQIAELQAKLAQKGFNRSQMFEMTPAVMNLARAGGEGTEEDTAISADLVSGSLRAFQADAKQAGHFSDVFTAAINNSNYSLDGLVTSMSYAAPVAKAYGVSLEDTVATLAGMTNLNLDPSMAGTAFRNMLLKMSDSKGRDEFNANLEDMTGKTIDFVDEAGNLRNLPELLFSIGEATKSLGSAQKGDLLNQLFGLRAIVPATALGQGKNAFAELQQILLNVTGTAKQTADEMDSGIGGSWRSVTSAVEGVAIAVGEALDGPLMQLSDWITTALGPFTEWIAANEEIIATIVAVATGVLAFGGAMIAGGIAVSAIGTLLGVFATALSLAGAALGFLLSPIGLTIAGIVGIGVAIEKTTGGITTGFQAATNFLAEQFGWLIETTRKTMSGIMDAIALGRFDLAFEIAWAGIKLVWATGIQWVMNTLDGWITAILNTFTDLHTSLAGLMTDIWDGIRIVWLGGISGLKIMLLTMIQFVIQKLGALLQKVGKTIRTVPGVKVLGGNIARSGEALGRVAGEVEKKKQTEQEELEKGIAAIGQESIDKHKALKEQRDKIIADRATKNASKSAARQKAVDEAEAELNAAISEVDKATAEAEKVIEENAPEIAPPKPPEDFTKEDTDTTPAAMSTGLIRGLERGTVEALEQASKNAQNKVWTKMLDKQDEQIVAINGVESAITNLGLEAV